MPTTRRLVWIAVAVAAATLTACASPGGDSSAPTTESESAPTEPAAQDDDAGDTDDVEAAWLDGGRMIGLVTIGSSTCVPVAGEVSNDGQTIDVELADADPDAVCTSDLAPRATPVGVPEGVDPAQDVTIRVTGAGVQDDTDLDGVADLAPTGATDYLPSAGWAGDDQLVLLTWGSSTCPPVVETVDVSAPDEVTVTWATPPADQACTMDMVPRAAVVAVDGIDDDAEAFVVLTGAEFDDVRVPIVGG